MTTATMPTATVPTALARPAVARTGRVVGHRLGDAAAPRRLVVYGTYECLHCRRAWPALRALVDDAAGALALEWRHFAPPGAFPNASHAAAVGEAAARQGAFWPMHEAMLAAPAPLWPEALLTTAAALGLDAERVARDAASPAVAARLAAQHEAAAADGVRGTPAVWLAGADGSRAPLDPRDLDALRAQVLWVLDAATRG